MAETTRRGHVLPAILELSSYVETLDLSGAFGRAAPLHVDLGCGDGTFLCEQARRFPEINFLGIERLLGRVASAARKAARLNNVRVLRVESYYAVRYLFPAVSVDTFYLMFPDPWPKRRHQRRRVVSEDFLAAIKTALIPGGTFHIATDQRDYFEQIRDIASSIAALATDPQPGLELPLTKFERRFQATGAPIYRLSLRKTSPVA